MPKFYTQNKKRIDPRYFLHEKAERVEESLASSLFLKARESAELDILSYFSMPSKEELERDWPMYQRQMPESKRPELWELRNYLIHGPSSKKTSGFDLFDFQKKQWKIYKFFI